MSYIVVALENLTFCLLAPSSAWREREKKKASLLRISGHLRNYNHPGPLQGAEMAILVERKIEHGFTVLGP